MPQIGNGSVLQTLQDRNLLLKVAAAPGTSLPEMDRITAAASTELRTLPGVTSVGAHVGRAVSSDQLVDVNSAEVWITLAGAADYGRSLTAIRAVMHGYPACGPTCSPIRATRSRRWHRVRLTIGRPRLRTGPRHPAEQGASGAGHAVGCAAWCTGGAQEGSRRWT